MEVQIASLARLSRERSNQRLHCICLRTLPPSWMRSQSGGQDGRDCAVLHSILPRRHMLSFGSEHRRELIALLYYRNCREYSLVLELADAQDRSTHSALDT